MNLNKQEILHKHLQTFSKKTSKNMEFKRNGNNNMIFFCQR